MTRRRKERNANRGLVGKAEQKITFKRILKWVLMKESGKTMTGLNWLRVGTSRLIQTGQCTIAFLKMQELS